MPRKPGLGPGIMRIEGLSDGREIRPALVDDFTGQPIPQADTALPRELPSVDELVQTQQRKRAHEAAQLCEWLGRAANVPALCTDTALPKATPPQPRLAHNQVLTQSGLVMTVISKRKDWRRL